MSAHTAAASFLFASAVLAKATPPPPRTPAPQAPSGLSIELEAKAPTKWTLRLKNGGASPLPLPVDPRLVALEITAPPARERGRARKATCELPADMRPTADEVGTLAIDAGKSVAIDFDPRLVCFSRSDAEVLAAADTVRARYSLVGMHAPQGKKTAVALGEPVTLGADAKPPVRPVGEAASPAPSSNDAAIEAPARIDAKSANDANVTVTVENTGDKSRSVFVRPGTIGFVVDGPSGAFTCDAKGMAPIREFERTLAPHAKASVDVVLGATCTGRAFDRPGLYVVRPLLSSPKPEWDDGRSLEGERVGTPSLIRLRTGRRPLLTSPPRVE